MNLEPFDIEKVKAGRKVYHVDGTASCKVDFFGHCVVILWEGFGSPSVYDLNADEDDQYLRIARPEMYVNVYEGEDGRPTCNRPSSLEKQQSIEKSVYIKFLGTYKLVKV